MRTKLIAILALCVGVLLQPNVEARGIRVDTWHNYAGTANGAFFQNWNHVVGGVDITGLCAYETGIILLNRSSCGSDPTSLNGLTDYIAPSFNPSFHNPDGDLLEEGALAEDPNCSVFDQTCNSSNETQAVQSAAFTFYDSSGNPISQVFFYGAVGTGTPVGVEVAYFGCTDYTSATCDGFSGSQLTLPSGTIEAINIGYDQLAATGNATPFTDYVPVPEPGSLALWVVGLGLLLVVLPPWRRLLSKARRTDTV